jgi:ribosomal protein L37AE/L43A
MDTDNAHLTDGLEPQVRKMRVCLSCGSEFESAWRGNRICQTCAAGSAGLAKKAVHRSINVYESRIEEDD